MCPLMTRMNSVKRVVRRFCPVNMIESTYTNADGIAYYIPRIHGVAYCSWDTNLYSMLPYITTLD